MKKKLFIFIITIFVTFLLLIIYLSFFGITTNKFNKNINDKIQERYPKINFEIKEINLLLNPLDFTVLLKTQNPKIKFLKTEIKIKELSTEYNIFSFIKKNFAINNVNLEIKKNKINQILKLIRTIKDSPQLYIIQNVVGDGKIDFKAKVNFDNDGNIKDNFQINGSIENLQFKLLNKEKLENINTDFYYADKNLRLENINLKYQNLGLESEKILIEDKNNLFNVNGSFKNKNSNISTKLLDLLFQNNILEDVILSSENIFNLNISKKYEVSDFNIKSSVNLKEASLIYKNKNIRKIIPDYNDQIKIKNHKIEIQYKNNLKLSGKGKIEINNKEDEIIYKFLTKKNIENFDINIIFDKIPLKFDFINYSKKENVKGNFKIKIKKEKENTLLENFSYKSNNLDLIGDKIIFDKNNDLTKFKKINMLFKDHRDNKNDLKILRKNNNYFITANNFALDKLVENIVTGDDKKNFNLFDNKKKFFFIDIKKAFLDDEHNLLDLRGAFEVQKNEVINLDLKSSFESNEKVSLTIKKLDNSKITTFNSDLAKPFVKKFEFIKGFEKGKIDFTSTENNGASKSILILNEFKLKELPALTKILTLASLQGISDLLTGEGVRFDELEMLFTNKDNLMTIEEIYSIGPAISILMEGYVQKDELISLKGTLVPATTINKFVASIPVLGEILVGKKTGEGVFGVSFKIKGPPKNLKTTVNPIKTLTPRFITRTLEKIKKMN